MTVGWFTMMLSHIPTFPFHKWALLIGQGIWHICVWHHRWLSISGPVTHLVLYGLKLLGNGDSNLNTCTIINRKWFCCFDSESTFTRAWGTHKRVRAAWINTIKKMAVKNKSEYCFKMKNRVVSSLKICRPPTDSSRMSSFHSHNWDRPHGCRHSCWFM